MFPLLVRCCARLKSGFPLIHALQMLRGWFVFQVVFHVIVLHLGVGFLTPTLYTTLQYISHSVNYCGIVMDMIINIRGIVPYQPIMCCVVYNELRWKFRLRTYMHKRLFSCKLNTFMNSVLYVRKTSVAIYVSYSASTSSLVPVLNTRGQHSCRSRVTICYIANESTVVGSIL